MQISSNESIAYSHRIYDGLYVVNLCGVKGVCLCVIEHTSKGVMTAGYLVSYSHYHFLALREELVHTAEISKISLSVHLVISIKN